MGTGAANSVTNSYGQTHELANLYVAGPGIFPTAGALNPTYTILARVAARRRAPGEELEHGRGLMLALLKPRRLNGRPTVVA